MLFTLLINANVSACQYKIYCSVYQFHFQFAMRLLSKSHCTELVAALHPLFLRVCAINPLNAELNPICHLMALLGAHHILHFSRIRVKGLTEFCSGSDKCSLLLSIVITR